jgi:hypothetical protein
MPRLRSVLVVVLIWLAAVAASSAPDGFGASSRAGTRSVGSATSRLTHDGKRWAVVASASGLRDLPSGANGKRWE